MVLPYLDKQINTLAVVVTQLAGRSNTRGSGFESAINKFDKNNLIVEKTKTKTWDLKNALS